VTLGVCGQRGGVLVQGCDALVMTRGNAERYGVGGTHEFRSIRPVHILRTRRTATARSGVSTVLVITQVCCCRRLSGLPRGPGTGGRGGRNRESGLRAYYIELPQGKEPDGFGAFPHSAHGEGCGDLAGRASFCPEAGARRGAAASGRVRRRGRGSVRSGASGLANLSGRQLGCGGGTVTRFRIAVTGWGRGPAGPRWPRRAAVRRRWPARAPRRPCGRRAAGTSAGRCTPGAPPRH